MIPAGSHYRIVVDEFRLSAAKPWMHLDLDMSDVPFDWLHVHECLELGICLAGRGYWVVGDRRLSFAPGTALAIPPGTPHLGRCHPGTSSRWEFLMVEPRLLVHGHQADREALDAITFSGRNFPVMLDPRQHAEACILVREAVLEAGRARPGHEGAVRGLCWAALARLRRLSGGSGAAVDGAALASLRPALARIARGDLAPPTVTELAALCRLGESSLRRRFRAALGLSTKAYLGRSRILRAAERLRDPRARVLQVALDAGFASPSGFNRQFRAVLGVSPRTWRTQALAESAPS